MSSDEFLFAVMKIWMLTSILRAAMHPRCGRSRRRWSVSSLPPYDLLPILTLNSPRLMRSATQIFGGRGRESSFLVFSLPILSFARQPDG